MYDDNHSHSIITKGYFGKQNKTVPESIRCFIICNIELI